MYKKNRTTNIVRANEEFLYFLIRLKLYSLVPIQIIWTVLLVWMVQSENIKIQLG